MNLAEALNAALPELPAKTRRAGYPKLDPRCLTREDIEDGQPVMVVHIRGTAGVYRFSPAQWQLIELFDGTRSYAEVGELFGQLTGAPLTGDEVREFAEGLDEVDFWYKTPQEKNIALSQKLSEQRHKHHKKKSKWGDVSHIQFSAWDPDEYMTKVYPYIRWVFSPVAVGLTLCLFAFMAYVFVDRWGEIGRDTLKYYTFTDKGFSDIAEFWVLFFILAFLHESAHGLTCKHYGGQVHRMGFHLIYLSPAFFVDVVEAWVYASRWQRLLTILAGIWMELIVCAFATVVWWGTAQGTYAHELSYKLMLITGVAVVVVNMNPLIKLDGYYAFSEMLGFSDIKEKSTSYVTSWVKHHIFRLPVEVDWVPRRRRWLYVPYCILSGLYSYMLLFVVVRFARNVFTNYSKEWAFIPALLLAYFIFRSRLRTLWRFMETVYLDKRESLRRWLTPPRIAAAAAVVLLVLFAPIWWQTVEGRFVLEPSQHAILRAEVPGRVEAVYVEEGRTIAAGALVAKLRNLDVQTAEARAVAELKSAQDKATEAQLRYASYGSALTDRERARVAFELASRELAKLSPKSPISGTVITPRVQNLVETQIAEGTTIAEIADLTTMRARVYIPEFELRYVRRGAVARLQPDDSFGVEQGTVSAVRSTSSPVPEGLIAEQEYKGIRAPEYYVAEVLLKNPGDWRDGMSGLAKIRVERRSIAGFVWQTAREFVGRKFW